MSEDITIERMSAQAALARGLMPGIDQIFFDTASRTYEPGRAREAFRERWLGRYLDAPDDVLLVGLKGKTEVWGYLVGTLENAAESPRFGDIAYFREDFREVCKMFPAHLHINLAASFRSRGLGAQLIEGFAQHVQGAALSGMHVVTGRGMRNVGFYARCGFLEQASSVRNGQERVFLGRRL